MIKIKHSFLTLDFVSFINTKNMSTTSQNQICVYCKKQIMQTTMLTFISDQSAGLKPAHLHCRNLASEAWNIAQSEIIFTQNCGRNRT